MREAILLLGVGCLAFMVVLSASEFVLKERCGMSYNRNLGWFGGLFLFASVALVYAIGKQVVDHLTWASVLLTVGSTLAYTGFTCWWERTGKGSIDSHKMFGVPPGRDGMMEKNLSHGLVKMAEIVFQQLCALVVIKGIFQFGLGVVATAVMFATVVCIVHLPSWRLFGPWFGRFFLYSSTGLALVYPLIITHYAGLGIMVAIHAATYIFWFLWLARKAKVLEGS